LNICEGRFAYICIIVKKVIAILMLFVVLLGTVTKDMSASKAAKSSYAQNDSTDKDDTKDGDGDPKEVSGKELADKLHFYHTEYFFSESLNTTLFSCVSIHRNSVDNPYLDCISLPPESLS
jgi:hypothetical protein